jgi:membrane-associated phospholipid phosphatase
LAGLVYPLDIGLSRVMSDTSLWPGDLRRVFKFSECFAHGSGILIILIAVWVLAPMARIHIPRIVACAFGAGLAANGMKLLVARRRPMVIDEAITDVQATWAGGWSGSPPPADYFDYGWQSFPSAHAATAAGLAIGLSWVFPRGRWLFAGLAMLASIQRIESQAHWPSDVLAGAATGMLVGVLFTVAGTPGNRLVTSWEQRPGFHRPARPATPTAPRQAA